LTRTGCGSGTDTSTASLASTEGCRGADVVSVFVGFAIAGSTASGTDGETTGCSEVGVGETAEASTAFAAGSLWDAPSGWTVNASPLAGSAGVVLSWDITCSITVTASVASVLGGTSSATIACREAH
jgi:hypothetical protein